MSAKSGLEAHEHESTVRSIAPGSDADKEELATAVTELVDVFADVVAESRELAAENDRLRERVAELEAAQEEATAKTDGMEAQVDDHEQRLEALGRGISAANDRLADLEAATPTDPQARSGTPEHDAETAHGEGATNGTATAGNDSAVAPETPLEQVVALPEHLADGELTANQQRARFVAADVWDYTTNVPAGRTIQAGDLSKVLRAGTDCRGHSQTVDRVIRLLDDLGVDEVEVVERRGQRRVVFSEPLCRRLRRLTARRDSSHDVVTGATG